MMARPGGWGLYERSHQHSLMAMLRLSAWGRGVMDRAGWSEEAGGQGQGRRRWGGVSLMNVCSGGSSPSWSAAGSQQWRRWSQRGVLAGAGGPAGAAAALTAGPC